MTAYAWKGRNARGRSVSGEVEADSVDAVANQLIASDITPVSIDRAPAAERERSALVQLLGRDRPDDSDLIFFSRQMYTLTRAGVPLSQGLKGVAASTRNPVLKRVIGDLKDSIEAGNELSQAMKRHGSGVFSSMYVNIIRVGEASGNLEQSFQLMGEYLARDREIRSNIKRALRYPALVVSAMAVAVAILMIFVIPRFAQFFERFGAELPWATKVIIGTSNFFVDWWWLLLLLVGGGILAFRLWVATPAGRYRWDRMKFRFPAVGDILFRATMARFARAFAITYRAGVPLIQGLTRVSQAIENEYVGQAVADMRTGIERGESLLRTAEATGLFSPLVLQMIAIGEETGEVDAMLEETADYYEREVDYDIDNLSALIEPVLLVFMAVLVLLLALGVFLPMWDVGRAALG
ncbi:MAG: type II secretion system F family protein [Wenzhouxiangellaceae bacterium]|nr:type II secretion system F family protein [Wenzhouxiangellaceae bacterium]